MTCLDFRVHGATLLPHFVCSRQRIRLPANSTHLILMRLLLMDRAIRTFTLALPA